MPRIIISFEEKKFLEEIRRIISQCPGFEFGEVNTSVNLYSFLETDLQNNDPHFLIYTKNMNPDSLLELQKISSDFPWIYSIYYHTNLNNKQFHSLYDSGVKSCIIGTKRSEFLRTNLNGFWEDHWKHIPANVYPKEQSSLSPRAKQIINIIENQHLRRFNINYLSEYLKISESHFRSEFKQLFGINFNGFKQKLLAFYEFQLLFELKIKANVVSRIMNYNSFSSFTRSFKSRHRANLSTYKLSK